METIPGILAEIPARPEKLWTKGKILENGFEGIAVVGTRKASAEGIAIAEEFAGVFASAGLPVISGLALGIDSAAHRGCLSVRGRTVAVLAGGIKKIYPSANVSLAEKIISSGGSVISEFEDEPSYPDLFLRRNRIISGLSRAVVVIEAPLKSGAVSTAAWAAEQGREVFVVPGPVTHPNYKGSHKLLRDGARLVASPEDVLSDLGIEKPEKRTYETADISEDAAIIMKLLKSSQKAVPIDKIVSMTRLEPQKVLSALTELHIINEVIETPSGYSLAFKS